MAKNPTKDAPKPLSYVAIRFLLEGNQDDVLKGLEQLITEVALTRTIDTVGKIREASVHVDRSGIIEMVVREEQRSIMAALTQLAGDLEETGKHLRKAVEACDALETLTWRIKDYAPELVGRIRALAPVIRLVDTKKADGV